MALPLQTAGFGNIGLSLLSLFQVVNAGGWGGGEVCVCGGWGGGVGGWGGGMLRL